MTSSSRKLLLTGATGFIGGSILTELLSPEFESVQDRVTISSLVRSESAAQKLRAAYDGKVTPVMFKGMDDTDTIAKVASEHDIVINTLNGYDAPSAAALVRGLSQRKKETGDDVFMIHTSGISNIADKPITGEKHPEDHAFNDATDDIYAIEKALNKETEYGQRTAELGVIDGGVELGVKTLIIMSPLIYGCGTGLFNKSSIQIPLYTKATLAQGHGVVVGDGKATWDYVHVEDLARLYKLALVSILDGAESGKHMLAFGTKGIIFSADGRYTWGEVAQRVADAAAAAGKISSAEVKSVGLKEGADALVGGDQVLVELGFSSNSTTKSTVARERLGWKPVKTAKDWEAGFADALKTVLEVEEK